MKQKIKTSVIITALICITILEMFAMYMGFNGRILSVVLVIIAGIAGLVVPLNKIIQIK